MFSSKEQCNKMTLFHSLNYWINIFYFFGLSPKFDTNHGFRFLDILPTVILFIFYSTLMTFGLYVFNTNSIEDGILDKFMTIFFLLCNAFMHVTIFLQTFIHRHIFGEILYGFDKINKLFVNLEHWDNEYDHLSRSFLRKFIFVIICYSLGIITLYIEYYPPNSFTLYASLFKLWQFLSTITFLNLVFFIDILRFHLNQLNLLIQTSTNCREDDKINLNKLKHFKTIFYGLWDISLKINHIFGWIIVALLFQAFFDNVYLLYWIIIGVINRRIADVLRK